MNKYFIVIVIMFITLPAFGQERDPFTPYSPETTAVKVKKNKNDQNHPLIDSALDEYRIIGLAIAPNNAVIVIKSPDKHEYFATIGDRLGSEGGVISNLTTDSITVNTGNDVVTIPVSNKFEMLDDEKKDVNKK